MLIRKADRELGGGGGAVAGKPRRKVGNLNNISSEPTTTYWIVTWPVAAVDRKIS